MPKDVGASRMGGSMIWSFNQSDYMKIFENHPHTRGGICEGLAASWINKTMQSESGLQTSLTTKNSIDTTKVALAALRFASMYRFKFSHGVEGRRHNGREMKDETTEFLESQGFNHEGTVGEMSKMRTFTLDQQFSLPFETLEDKDYFKQQGTTRIFSMLRLNGRNWAHTMVFRIEPTASKKTVFFDPNKGEFKFLRYADFKNWYAHFHRQNNRYRTSLHLQFDVFTYT